MVFVVWVMLPPDWTVIVGKVSCVVSFICNVPPLAIVSEVFELVNVLPLSISRIMAPLIVYVIVGQVRVPPDATLT